MAISYREQVGVALWTLVSRTQGITASSRRFVHWDQVAGGQLPFLTILKMNEERIRQADGTPAIKFFYHVFVYAMTGDATIIPETQANQLLDYLDEAVKATISDIGENRQTLGGLVWYCQPRGRVFVDTGDVDGKAVMAVPFEILMPWFT